MAESTGKVICLVGPTGTGKTEAALRLAERVPCGIVNIDSRQVYRDFPIITAQPSERELMSCPHRLYGFLPSDAKIDAGRFSELAEESVGAFFAEGRLPVLVGGTGLYVDAVLYGLAPIPEVPPEVRARVQEQWAERGAEALYRDLEQADPEAARAIHPRDRQRVTRALEVLEATGKPISWWQQRNTTAEPKYRCLKVGLSEDLPALEPRLLQRIERMIEAGAVDEARRAWQRCPNPSAPAWSGIGCAEMLAALQGRISWSEARLRWFRRTRQYAKRQLTWFRKDAAIRWLSAKNAADVVGLVEDWLEEG